MSDVSVEITMLNQNENSLSNSNQGKTYETMIESTILDGKEVEGITTKEQETDNSDTINNMSADKDNSNTTCRYWWLVANPKNQKNKDGEIEEGWSFNNIGDEDTVDFDSKRKNNFFKSNFKYLHENDKFIGFETGDKQEVVALGICTDTTHINEGLAIFKKEKTLRFPVTKKEVEQYLKSNNMNNMSYFNNPQGTLFDLKKEEYDCIMQLICKKNPDIQNEIPDNPNRDDVIGENTITKKENYPKNLILYGPPGTGKTYNTVAYAVAICKRKTKEELEKLNEFKDASGLFNHDKVFKAYEIFRNAGRIKFITFHQSYGYEEFIEGIKPKLDISNKNDLQYEIKDGSFKAFCKQANPACICKKTAERSNADSHGELQPYVFIIDEINRGNISKIFGELITLIEPNKRLGAKETRWATLPYSEEEFSVPGNVYILGTMNTADRSLALMDTALRRRFNFIEMMPDLKLFDNPIPIDGCALDVITMLDTINKRIECLYDREHTIGHGYFLKLNKEENQTIDVLKEIFKEKIIPLLQEYFYDDYSKIQLVLGDNQKDDKNKFIKSVPYDVSALNKLFGTGLDIDKQERYEINNDANDGKSAFDDIDSYIGIYLPKKTKNDIDNNAQKADA